jgi:hypothetical protein
VNFAIDDFTRDAVQSMEFSLRMLYSYFITKKQQQKSSPNVGLEAS